MSLIGPKLSQLFEGFSAKAPAKFLTPITNSRTSVAQYDFSHSIKEGDQLPPFTLQDPDGHPVSSAELLTRGPLLITFYRGEWCPFCNIALVGFQEHLAQIQAKGVTLVAITPELATGTRAATAKHALQFPVLTDLHSAYARELGISWKQSPEMKQALDDFGHDLPRRNGDDSYEVPLPVTLLVARDGTVRNAYREPDYVKRVEPQTVLQWIDAL